MSVFTKTDQLMDIGIILSSLLAYLIILNMIIKRMDIKKYELFYKQYLSPTMLITFCIMMFGFVIISTQIDIFINRLLPMSQFLIDLLCNTAKCEYLVISIILLRDYL